MQRIKPLLVPLCAAALGVMIEVALCNCGLQSSPAVPDGPQTLSDVAEIAAKLGLQCRGQLRDGSDTTRGCCLVVSDRPLNWDEANNLSVNSPGRPCWFGTVAVFSPGQSWVANFDPEHSAFWGKTFVYGDPAIIRRLTGSKDLKTGVFGEPCRWHR